MSGLSLSKFRWWPSKGTHLGSSNTNDTSLLMLTLICNAAITKLGQAKISCPQFFVPDWGQHLKLSSALINKLLLIAILASLNSRLGIKLNGKDLPIMKQSHKF
ncbi:hypothetical protein ACFX15_027475 [Malus domestica]